VKAPAKEILVSAFTCGAASQAWAGLWSHPRSAEGLWQNINAGAAWLPRCHSLATQGNGRPDRVWHLDVGTTVKSRECAFGQSALPAGFLFRPVGHRLRGRSASLPLRGRLNAHHAPYRGDELSTEAHCVG
jgi:hypothetical protein